jgi:hypothetical protein
MRQAEAGTEVAESSQCPTPAHTPSHGQADMQTQCNLMIDVLQDSNYFDSCEGCDKLRQPIIFQP